MRFRLHWGKKLHATDKELADDKQIGTQGSRAP